MTDTRPPRGADQFPLRLPAGMRDRIKAAADASGRSMNAEILATLTDAYPAPEPDAPDLAQIMEDLQGATSPDDFAARARAANAALEAAGSPYRVDMVSPVPGKIAFSRAPQVPVPSEGETFLPGGRTVPKG